jgi:hypothetical protein
MNTKVRRLKMLPDEMEAEKNRKIIVAQADEIDILKCNVEGLQKALQEAYKKISVLTIANIELKEKECSCGLMDAPVIATEEY